MVENNSKKDAETMIEQFNADISKFILLKNMFGYCGICGCTEKKKGKPGKNIKFETVYEKNTSDYLSSFCEKHSAMVKEKIDQITDACKGREDSN